VEGEAGDKPAKEAKAASKLDAKVKKGTTVVEDKKEVEGEAGDKPAKAASKPDAKAKQDTTVAEEKTDMDGEIVKPAKAAAAPASKPITKAQ